LIGISGHQNHRCDPFACEFFGGGDTIQVRHLDVHDQQVWAKPPREVHGGPAISGFANDIVSEVRQHLSQIESDQGFIIGDDNAPPGGAFLNTIHRVQILSESVKLEPTPGCSDVARKSNTDSESC
jgi:hypothetical protein